MTPDEWDNASDLRAMLTWLAQQRMLSDRKAIFAPFRTTRLNPVLLTPAILNLAGAAYNDRDLPSATLRVSDLAAALEAEGCEDAEIRSHLRSPGMHWRGCWALDEVLGRS